MHPCEAVRLLGGVASRSQLEVVCDPSDVRRLIRSRDLTRVARGRYATADIDEAGLTAGALQGVLSHTSAAPRRGWEVFRAPEKPHVTVRRSRKLTPAQRASATVHHVDLADDDVVDGVTSVRRTLADCLRLPLEEAVAVADSAVRAGDVDEFTVQRIAADLRGPGAATARRAASLVDARSANPFESVLKVLASQVAGLDVTPQVPIELPGLFVRPDLVDVRRRIVLEADSHAWHSTRSQLRRDCVRYTLLAADGWLVLRFSWEDVMFRADYVREVLARAVALSDERAQQRRRAA
ncbi:DUF559 domain-containing protein [Nocardioidaceae bacterium]|nr:DUF559 domain-containing protein [Nocardioidaceae bacterium]